ncbi:MAG TPA: NAD(P)H-binding protein [Gemmatimonadales bacterium]
MTYRALVLGATGAVGSALTRELLASTTCAQVIALVRRPTPLFDALPGKEKLKALVVDLGQLEQETARVGAGCEAAFCTMGVGQPRKVGADEHWRVDVEYAGAFARGAKVAGTRHISLLSAVGANRTSMWRYSRVKGAAEAAVAGAGIARTSMFRPSLLVTQEIRYGLQDRLTQAIFPVVSLVMPSVLHEVTVETLGRAMRVNAERPGGPGLEILQYPEFRALQA